MIGKPEERKKIKEFNEWKRIRLLSLQKKSSSSSSTSTRSIVFRFKSSTTTTKMNPNENKTKKNIRDFAHKFGFSIFCFLMNFFSCFQNHWFNDSILYLCLCVCFIIATCDCIQLFFWFFFPFGNQIIQMKKTNDK